MADVTCGEVEGQDEWYRNDVHRILARAVRQELARRNLTARQLADSMMLPRSVLQNVIVGCGSEGSISLWSHLLARLDLQVSVAPRVDRQVPAQRAGHGQDEAPDPRDHRPQEQALDDQGDASEDQEDDREEDEQHAH